jgi:VanZ family protein
MLFKERWLVCIAAAACWTALLLAPISTADLGVDEAASWPFFIPILMHVLGYMLLTIAVGWLQPAPRLRLWLLYGLCAHGIVLELVQPWFGRDGTLPDAALDLLGIFIGLIVARRFWFG